MIARLIASSISMRLRIRNSFVPAKTPDYLLSLPLLVPSYPRGAEFGIGPPTVTGGIQYAARE
jgi:hypothetical protein